MYPHFLCGLDVILEGRKAKHPIPPDDHRCPDVLVDQPSHADEETHSGGWNAKDYPDVTRPEFWRMKITQSAYHSARDYFFHRKPEVAGWFMGPADDDSLITHFEPDENAEGTSSSVHLNYVTSNDMLKRYKSVRMDAKGVGHSHPLGITSPSQGDLLYMKRLFGLPANANAQQCFLPIFCNGRFYPYIYARGRLWVAELILI